MLPSPQFSAQNWDTLTLLPRIVIHVRGGYLAPKMQILPGKPHPHMKRNWANVGLVLRSYWAGFVVKAWQPCLDHYIFNSCVSAVVDWWVDGPSHPIQDAWASMTVQMQCSQCGSDYLNVVWVIGSQNVLELGTQKTSSQKRTSFRGMTGRKQVIKNDRLRIKASRIV